MRKLIELVRRSLKKRLVYYESDPELNMILASVQEDFGP